MKIRCPLCHSLYFQSGMPHSYGSSDSGLLCRQAFRTRKHTARLQRWDRNLPAQGNGCGTESCERRKKKPEKNADGFQTVSLKGIYPGGWDSQKKESPLEFSGLPSRGGRANPRFPFHILLTVSHSWLRPRLQAVPIKRRPGEPSKQHRGLKNSGEHKEEPPNNAGHPHFSVLTRSLTSGFKLGNGTPRRAIHTPPFPYLAMKRADDADSHHRRPSPCMPKVQRPPPQPQASPYLPFFLQFLHFSENRTAVDLKVLGDLGDAAVTLHRG